MILYVDLLNQVVMFYIRMMMLIHRGKELLGLKMVMINDRDEKSRLTRHDQLNKF